MIRNKRSKIALAMTVMSMIALPLSAVAYNGDTNGDRPDSSGFEPNQNLGFGEIVVGDDGTEYGVYLDGTLFPLGSFVNRTTGSVWDAGKGPFELTANWSDDLVLHKWNAGQKVRTEVVLWDPAHAASVFSLRARFTIDELDEGMNYLSTVWSGNVSQKLWADGRVDGYSAEINQVGMLLYGYNWNTRGLQPGLYRLTFELEQTCLHDGYAAEYQAMTITGVDDAQYAGSDNYALFDLAYDASSTSIVIELLDSKGGN
jgi:hypothetical protein